MIIDAAPTSRVIIWKGELIRRRGEIQRNISWSKGGELAMTGDGNWALNADG